jgi:hypothetical protein
MMRVHLDDQNEDWLPSKRQKPSSMPAQGPSPFAASLGQVVASLSRRTASGDIHPGDRVRVTDEVDGLEQDQMGVCMEVQNDVAKVKLDGEPIPRWISKDILQQDQAKEDVLQEMEEGEDGEGGEGGEGGGGMADLLGLLGG